MTIKVGRLQKGLIGHWSLDAIDGNIARDSSGNDNHGTMVNDPQIVSGTIGDGLSFSATNPNEENGVVVEGIDHGSNQWTVTCWAYVEEGRRNDSSSSNAGLMEGWMGSTGWSGGPLLNSSSIRYNLDGGGSRSFSTKQLFGELRFYAFTFDGDIFKAYVDMEEEGSDTLDLTASDTWNLYFCYWGSDYHFYGEADDIRYYNRVLSEDELRSLYQMRTQQRAYL